MLLTSCVQVKAQMMKNFEKLDERQERLCELENKAGELSLILSLLTVHGLMLILLFYNTMSLDLITMLT